MKCLAQKLFILLEQDWRRGHCRLDVRHDAHVMTMDRWKPDVKGE